MAELSAEEKAQKKAEKAARAAEFAKNNPNIGKTAKPKLTKAERRAKQEAQRAAKVGEGGGKGGGDKSEADKDKKGRQEGNQPQRQQTTRQQTTTRTASQSNSSNPTPSRRKDSNASSLPPPPPPSSTSLNLFDHLPPYRPPPPLSSLKSSLPSQLPRPIIDLGRKYSSLSIDGANDRAVAMLTAFKSVVQSFTCPPNKELRFHLVAVLKTCFQHLTECRPHSISMGNAFNFLKSHILKLNPDLSSDDAKQEVTEGIDRFIQERIRFASSVIARVGVDKINDDDVILTFSYSASVLAVLLLARENATPFRVILVDPRVGDGGACNLMAKSLLTRGVPVTYVGMEGVSYVMRDVSVVMLGAEGVMSNGSVFARVGTLGVAQAAKAYRKPTLVCCEGYKFTNKVQLDSITHNELGSVEGMGGGGEDKLNLLYDLTPSELVGGVVTETGLLPGSSVAVLLREME
ncbi:hypothetical protein TrCOL_g13379 [Triparma columacea]|uniref:Translation initiation factor eIF2B subunit delta n=1 Tax=Triparma columacea TaxID=722753 RepID=A0A9W7LBV3_9STRA|nr:hypothetical protein TrCOL_g13379 [Triparma columacea]